MDLSHLLLPPELKSFVAGQVGRDGFESAADVIHAALWIMRDQEESRQMHLEELRMELAPAFEESARGESRPLDIEDVIRAGRGRLAEKRPGV